MKIRFITCSDPRENTSVESILNFTEKYPIAEIGLQAYPAVMSSNKQFNTWFNQLLENAQNMPTPPNIALHVNRPWSDYISAGFIPSELGWQLSMKNVHTGRPVIQRIQLNIGDYPNKIDIKRLTTLIKQHSCQEFILPWNERMANKIETLKLISANFSLLFDESAETETWRKPIYKDISCGYSGGLGPDNIAKNLDKISTVLPEDSKIWVDAKGKLCDTETTFSFSLESAEKYVKNATAWYNQHTK